MLNRAVQAARRRTQGGAGHDKGATMVLATISMLVLLMFGAMAVDLGGAWSQRRENQAAVDPGGVAGALQTRGQTQAAAIAAADTEIIRITYSSIGPSRTFAEWTTDWTNCVDPDKGAQFTITGSSDCISYTSNLQRMRVRTPQVETRTTFAGVIGLDTISTHAAAEIIIGFETGGGAILPFGLPGNAAADVEICLKSGANPKNVAPCDGPDTGNFGFLDITEFGNDLLNSTTTCTGQTTTRTARNIARGVDHPMVEAPSAGATFRRDRDGCNSGNFNYAPYSLTTEPGNMTGVIDDGFIGGVSGLPGRLTLSSDTVTHGGNTFDDKPLWEYLNGAGTTFCNGVAGVVAGVSDHDEMILCLAAMSGSTVYFVDSIADSARFAWVPLFHGTTLGNGATTLNIDEFRPVYIQTTLWKCNANACNAIHDPSEMIQGSIAGNDKLEAVTALQIPRTNLPDAVDDGFFGKGGETFYAITD